MKIAEDGYYKFSIADVSGDRNYVTLEESANVASTVSDGYVTYLAAGTYRLYCSTYNWEEGKYNLTVSKTTPPPKADIEGSDLKLGLNENLRTDSWTRVPFAVTVSGTYSFVAEGNVSSLYLYKDGNLFAGGFGKTSAEVKLEAGVSYAFMLFYDDGNQECVANLTVEYVG